MRKFVCSLLGVIALAGVSFAGDCRRAGGGDSVLVVRQSVAVDAYAADYGFAAARAAARAEAFRQARLQAELDRQLRIRAELQQREFVRVRVRSRDAGGRDGGQLGLFNIDTSGGGDGNARGRQFGLFNIRR